MSEEKRPMIKVENLQTHFPVYGGFFKHKVGSVKAVDDISITVEHGETLGLVGESGCGKTTLGKTLMGLTKATGGKIYYDLNGALQDMGHEKVLVQDSTKLTEVERRNQEDAVMYIGEGGTSFELDTETFLLVYPGEAHLPKLIHEFSTDIDKIVFKIHV